MTCFDGKAWGSCQVQPHLILLDKREAVLPEECGTAIDGKLVGSVQLCGFLLVHGCVAMLLQLWHEELLKVVALNLL